jgi:hemolysin activation/secretion protein
MRWLACALVIVPAAVFAQAVPGPVQPGQIERQLKPQPEPRTTTDEVVVPAVPTERRPPGAEAVRFALKAVVLEGSSVYDSAVVSAAASKYTGREVSLAEVYDLADALTARYRSDGYVLSQVIVPPQSIREGVVKLQAVEGYIAQVTIEGTLPGRKSDLEAYARKVTESRPLHAAVLERYLLLINDLGGVFARAVLSPSPKEAGASDLLIEVSARRFGGVFRVGNRGSDFYGPWQADLTGIVYSLGGGFETTAVRVVSTIGNDELRFASILHDQPLGAEGLKLSVSGSYVDADPGLEERLGGVRLDTRSTSAAVALSYPVLRTRARNFHVRGLFTYYNGETNQMGQAFSEDRIRAVRFGAAYDFADAWRGVNLFDAEIAQGLDILNATETGSPNLSRSLGRSDFTKATLYAARLQGIAAKWSVLAALTGQYAANNLLSPEQFAVGGEHFGRGYDPSEIVGDSGVAGKVELRYAGGPVATWLGAYTAYASYDIGQVWQRSVPPGQDATQSIASAALGVRFTLRERLSGYIEAAKPLTRVVFAEGDRDARVFVGLAANL